MWVEVYVVLNTQTQCAGLFGGLYDAPEGFEYRRLFIAGKFSIGIAISDGIKQVIDASSELFV